MKRKLPLALLLAPLLLAGCRQTDIRTVVIQVPGVRNEACAQRVRQALAPLRAIDHTRLAFDLAAGTVQVTYDSMQLARKNIELSIVYAGFDANEIPADAAARAALPPECRPALSP
jgi:copper chaperone CopZ